MTIQALNNNGSLILIGFNALTSGNTTANQWLNSAGDRIAPTQVQEAGQNFCPVSFNLLRVLASFQTNGNQQATMMLQIDGAPQNSTSISLTLAGTTIIDLPTPIKINLGQKIEILFTTAIADAATTRPKYYLIGKTLEDF